jgi:hypothetical protein
MKKGRRASAAKLSKVLDDLLGYLSLPDKLPAQGTAARTKLVGDFAARLGAAHHTACVVLGYIEGMKILVYETDPAKMESLRRRGMLKGMSVVLEHATTTLAPSGERLSSLNERLSYLMDELKRLEARNGEEEQGEEDSEACCCRGEDLCYEHAKQAEDTGKVSPAAAGSENVGDEASPAGKAEHSNRELD